jgi:hypothetical protein
MQTDDFEEFDSPPPPPADEHGGLNVTPVRGEIVTKTRLGAIVGKSQTTIEAWIKNGMPVIARGTKREGWKIDTAAAIDWAVRYAVALATGDPESMALDTAKRRKEAALAQIKEMELERELGRTMHVPDVINLIAPKFGEFRSRALGLRSQVPGLTAEQDAALRDAVNEMLADFSNRSFWKGTTAADLGAEDFSEFDDINSEAPSDEIESESH